MRILRDFKAIIKQARIQQDADNKSPDSAISPKEGFEGLQKLSETPGSRFRVIGDARHAVIIPKPDYLPISLWFVFIMASVISAAADMNREFILFMMPVFFGALFLTFRLAPTTYEITLDSFAKQISMQSNNPIGRFVKPKVVIGFDDFDGLSSKVIYSKMKDGLNTSFNKVFIHYKSRMQALIYLANGLNKFIDHERFISNFSALIAKREKPA